MACTQALGADRDGTPAMTDDAKGYTTGELGGHRTGHEIEQEVGEGSSRAMMAQAGVHHRQTGDHHWIDVRHPAENQQLAHPR